MTLRIRATRQVVEDGDSPPSVYVEVGPDRGGWGCVEIRSDRESALSLAEVESMTFSPEVAKLVARAMLACAEELEQEEPE